MKKSGFSLFCLFTVLVTLGASDFLRNPRKVMLNGKPLVSGYNVNGTWFVALEDLSKAVGATTTLEPRFKLQGKILLADPGGMLVDKHKSAIKIDAIKGESIKVESIKGESVKLGDIKVQQGNTAYKDQLKIKLAPGQTLQVARGGQVSAKIEFFNGKAYVPLTDVIKALGATGAGSLEQMLSPAAAGPINLLQDRGRCQAMGGCILIGL